MTQRTWVRPVLVPVLCLAAMLSLTGIAALATPGDVPSGAVDSADPLLGDQTGSPFEDEDVLTISAEVEEEPAILDVHRVIFQHTWHHSPDIRMARLLVEQKAALRHTAWARRLSPKVDFELSQKQYFNRSDSTSTGTSGSTNAGSGTGGSQEPSFLVGPEDSSTTGSTAAVGEEAYVDGDSVSDWIFSLDFPLYRRAVSLQLDTATLDEELAGLNLAIKSQELDTRVRMLLGNYLLAQYRLLNLCNSVEIARAHVDRTRRGFVLRDQTRLSLLRTEANLNELEARRDVFEQQQESAFRELLNFTGMVGMEPVFPSLRELTATEARTAGCIMVLADLGMGLERVGQLVPEAEPEAVRQRFMLHSPLAKKYALERRLGDIRARTFTQYEGPELAVKGEYGRKKDTRFRDYSGEGYVGVVLTIPLFSGGTMFSNLRSQNVTLEMSGLGEFSQLRTTYFGLENRKKSIDSLREVLEKHKLLLRQQEEIVRLSVKSFKMKETSMQDLLIAQNKMIDSKNQYMATANELGSLLRQFAWEMGSALPSPPLSQK